MAVNKHIVSKFKGLKTIIKDPKELEDGTPQDSLNWLTGSKGDHIELRGGSKNLCLTKVDGLGAITGLNIGVRSDGVEVPFFSHGRKLKYYDDNLQDFVEIGTDVLPETADNEDMAIEFYNGVAGSFVYISSPHSSVYKIPVANPGSVVNQQSKTFRGYFKIKQSRTFMWNTLNATTGFFDRNGLSLSYIDKQTYAQFDSVSGEGVGTGNGVNKVFSGTLLERKGTRTVFNIRISAGGAVSTFLVQTSGTGYKVSDVITVESGDFNCTLTVATIDGVGGINTATLTTAGTGYQAGINQAVSGGSGTSAFINITSIINGETFVDDKCGNLNGSAGGTGTIDYATGDYTLTFAIAPANGLSLTANYLWENSLSEGILDFSYSATRTVGQGDYFRQDDGGGDFMNVFALDDNVFCLHKLKTWNLVLTSDDTKATNLPYRDKVNIPFWRAGDETDDGILCLFIGDQNFPKLAILSYGQYTQTIVPDVLSEEIDFTPYGIDTASVKRWGNYDFVCVKKQTNGVNDLNNDIMFARNIVSGEFDRLDYNASMLAPYKNGLLAGDSISNNVYQLFSGYDDDGQTINNYWISNQSDLGINGTKKATYFRCDGFISRDQNFDVLAQYDNGSFVAIGNISGDGSYVDYTAGTIVGSDTVGVQVVGGGSVPNAFHFRVDLKANTPLFEEVTIMFKANGIGALQINEYGFNDIRAKGNRTIPVYTKN